MLWFYPDRRQSFLRKIMKRICFSLLLGLSILSSSPVLAQQSTNFSARGFVDVTVRAGQIALLAVPLILPTNTLTAVLAQAPAGTEVFKFDTTSQRFLEFAKQADGSWAGAGADSATLDVGEGFFVKNSQRTDFAISFDGLVPQGSLTVQIPAGFSLLASKVPQAGRLETDLNLIAQPEAKAYLLRNGSLLQYTRRAAGWTGLGGEPIVDVAEGFFFYSPKAITWTRSFSIVQ
jgi:hypothetical protein